MPEFLPGSEHIAHAPVSNPTSTEFYYELELYLVQNGDKKATSGIIPITLAAGAADTVDFPVVMPQGGGTYQVYLDVFVADEIIAAYQATDPVTISPPVTDGFEVHWATINGKLEPEQTILLGEEIRIEAQIGNLSPDPATVNVCCYFNQEQLCQEVVFEGGYQESYWTEIVAFEYTPTEAGEVMVQLGDWSGTVQVIEDVIGTFYSPWGCLPLEGCYWQYRNAFIEAIAWRPTMYDPDPPYRDCATKIYWYGTGTGTNPKTALRCPYCGEGIEGPHRDYIGIAQDMLTHIQSVHPQFPLAQPPAWVIKDYEQAHEYPYMMCEVVGHEHDWLPGRIMPLPAGTYTIQIWEVTGRVPGPEYEEKTLIKEVEVTLGWGDRAYCDADAQQVTVTTWGELCS